MTTTDYFLAAPGELTQACRGWVEPGRGPASRDASPHAEYFNLTWADLKSVDTVVLGPLAAILLESDLDVAEEHMAPSLEGPGDEQALFVLSDELVQRLAGLADAQLPAVVTSWLVPLRGDASSIQMEFVRDHLLEGLTLESFVPVLTTLRDLARHASAGGRRMFMLVAP